MRKMRWSLGRLRQQPLRRPQSCQQHYAGEQTAPANHGPKQEVLFAIDRKHQPTPAISSGIVIRCQRRGQKRC